jgi:prepilin-type N-terminal cleavage/methylation domain-containing protein
MTYLPSLHVSQPKSIRRTKIQGFTLIELLIVMVIVGIVATILLGFFVTNLRKTQLRDGAVQLMADMRQARSQAQRTSQGSSVILTSTSVGSPSKTYRTQWGGAATPTTKTLSDPIRVAPFTTAPVNSGNSLSYSAPYGEVTGTGVVWEISSTVIPNKYYVKAVGVTGKVILSATPN